MGRRGGFTLLEVLISAVILGIISVAFIEFLGNAGRGQKNVQNSTDFDIFKNSISILLTSKYCGDAFKNSSDLGLTLSHLSATVTSGNALTQPEPVIKLQRGTSLLAAPNMDLGGGLSISRLEITEAWPDGTSGAYNRFLSKLVIEAKKTAEAFGAKTLSKTFDVVLYVDPTAGNKIMQCSYDGLTGGGANSSTGTLEYGQSGEISMGVLGDWGNNGTLTVPNPLAGRVPSQVNISLLYKGTSPSNGYKSGDKIFVDANHAWTGYIQYEADANNVYITKRNRWYLENKDGTGYFYPDDTNWKLNVEVTAPHSP